MPEPAWKRHLDDPAFARWFEIRRSEHEAGAVENGRVLDRYLTWAGLTPSAMAKAASTKRGLRHIEEQLQDFMLKFSKPHEPTNHGGDDPEVCGRGHPRNYLVNYRKAVASFLRHHRVILVAKVTIPDNGGGHDREREHIPTRQEITGILEGATMRGRVIVTCVAFSSIRPAVVGTMRDRAGRPNGLRLEDLPDLDIDSLRFAKHPPLLQVRRELSKTGHPYFTFIPTFAERYVLDYLRHRRARGESLGPKSPLVIPDYSSPAAPSIRNGRRDSLKDAPYLGTPGVLRELRGALRSRGIASRPYIMRHLALIAFELGEHDQKVTREDREFWAGHVGTVTATYTKHHEQLPPEMVEAMRAAFASCEQYMTEVAQLPPMPREEFERDLLKNAEAVRRNLREAKRGEDPETVALLTAIERSLDFVQTMERRRVELEQQMKEAKALLDRLGQPDVRRLLARATD